MLCGTRVLLFCLLLAPSVGGASPIIRQATGLASPDAIVDFGESLYSSGTIITNEFASQGVTFGPDYAYRDGLSFHPALTRGYLQNTTSGNQPGSIFFSTDVTSAAFSYTSNIANTTFSAFLDGVLVESFTAPTEGTTTAGGSGLYHGFEGIVFDEIRMELDIANTLMSVDNLQYVAVPEPGTALLFGLGLGFMARTTRRRHRGREIDSAVPSGD